MTAIGAASIIPSGLDRLRTDTSCPATVANVTIAQAGMGGVDTITNAANGTAIQPWTATARARLIFP